MSAQRESLHKLDTEKDAEAESVHGVQRQELAELQIKVGSASRSAKSTTEGMPPTTSRLAADNSFNGVDRVARSDCETTLPLRTRRTMRR